MLNTFNLTIGNDADWAVLDFDILETSIAQKWAYEIAQDYPIYENDRFTNWPNAKNNRSYYEYWLKHHIDVITKFGHPIAIDLMYNQDSLNQLHKHFEDLRGHVDMPAQWYINAPYEIQQSVDKLNILIHEYENYLHEEKDSFKNPTIVCTFKDRPKYALQDEDFLHFTHQWQYGTVYINYCEVGKPLLDVFKDRDFYVEAIRPQTTYSADFMIKFGPDVPIEYAETKQRNFEKWYKEQNLDFKNLSLGMIPVAKIKQNIDITEYFKYNRVINVSCRK